MTSRQLPTASPPLSVLLPSSAAGEAEQDAAPAAIRVGRVAEVGSTEMGAGQAKSAVGQATSAAAADFEIMLRVVSRNAELTTVLHRRLRDYMQHVWDTNAKAELAYLMALCYTTLLVGDAHLVDELVAQARSRHALLETSHGFVASAAIDIQRAMRGSLARRQIATRMQHVGASRVLVFGSLNIDLKASVNGDWAHTGATSFLGNFSALPGGKGLNQAVDCARLGVKTHLIGLVGRDNLSAVLLEFLSSIAREGNLIMGDVNRVDEQHTDPAEQSMFLSETVQSTGVAVQASLTRS